MGEPFLHPLRPRFAECDAQSVVFNAHYLAYFDISMTELWRAAFGSYQSMLDRGVDIVVVETQIRFRSPARFDDELALEVAIERLGTTSISSRHRIWRGEELLVEGTIAHVLVDRVDGHKTPLPEWMRTGLEPWTVPAAAPADRAVPAEPAAPAKPTPPAGG